MNTEIIKIIEAGLDRDPAKVKKYAEVLRQNSKENNPTLSRRISTLLNKSKSSSISSDISYDLMTNKPVDSESRLEMVDIYYPSDEPEQLVFPIMLTKKVDEFIETIKNRQKLESLRLGIPQSLLLYGPPGNGKTSLAKHIAIRLNMPLIVISLDTMISSLLGRTAKNIYKVFEYADGKNAILFLDEFDAIAKARDDKHEAGELKRVVNSLLQRIDAFSSNNILLAATNHHQMLDPAVWRRFTLSIKLDLPTENEITQLLEQCISRYPIDFDNSPRKKHLIDLFAGMSYAEIKNIYFSAIKSTIVKRKPCLEYFDLLLALAQNKNQIGFGIEETVRFLHKNKISKQQIHEALEVPTRRLDKYLAGEL